MKLSKALIGAIVIGIAIQTSGCEKDDSTKPEKTQSAKNKKPVDNCPACGMG